MFKQFSSIFWGCLLVVGLSACAQHTDQRRFSADGQPSPLFSGKYRGGIFQQGEVSFGDTANTLFRGQFDSKGFPRQGELRQSYRDRNGEWLELVLNGDFILEPTTGRFQFSGGFVIIDSMSRVLASAEYSHWQSEYVELHPFQSPAPMVMQGDNSYTQFRRDISPAGSLSPYVKVNRPLAGPFTVEVNYQAGMPRGIVKISAATSDGNQYVVERQYYNYQIESEPVHYFYYEPGSYSDVDLLGGCDLMPNLTAPQQMLNVYAYDCEKASFYALSDKFPASVLAIAVADIDNGGAFHRFTLYHHGEVSYINISVDALYNGQWVRHGDVRHMHYGSLKSFARYQLGTPIGIGIDVNQNNARYIQFTNPVHEAEALPSVELFDRINARHEWQIARFNSHFSTLLSARIVSAADFSTLKTTLLADLKNNKAIAQDGQVPGLTELWQSWQRQSRARIVSWKLHGIDARVKTLAAMHRLLKADLDKWVAQSQALLIDEAGRRCELAGQSFSSEAWQCESQPDVRLTALCERYLGQEACNSMAAQYRTAAAR
jgi:hypothetical protein